ncbi:vesicle-associated membrane protein-associated protein B-like [Pollicipes pollicipes]|uniref:vesicle-associated membrane protein-associated protein B-like n=2 Tax=Pollicipes pollicipes TaxID=41117 RepID=UPI00188522F7|nr:vesicle-associated membrane protein-associated protein B-like [Pollicipes pollicipes]XP_037077999.1 vesicle-associated membrane protein-associated protein B-like [Pollicipes pollicipes]XP_037078398.1 vesicle-associated membrane protein-associated protein B-like [Pollicipes pollicipes]
MSTSDNFLVIEPSQELRFKGPFKDEVSSSSLTLTNTSDKKITFKIKTTAPKRYCVRPNQGIVEPGATVNIAVMLQPFDYDPAEKNKHKFMVQTMFLPEGEEVELETLWKTASPEQIMTSNKMRCVFELPADAQEDLVNRPEPKDMKMATEELRKLREDLSSARGENLQLREEGIRLRRQLSSAASAPGSAAADAAPADTTMYYVMAAVALVIGVIVGKLVM